MELTGSHILNAPASTIWKMLMNPEILAKVTPGISRLELESEGLYKAIADVKMGPVNGRFEGSAEVIDPIENQSFTLKVLQNSKIGNVSADVKMMLNAISASQTELSFEGKADMSGLLARTGQRVMAGVASTLTKQFFGNFEQELATMPEVIAAVEAATTETKVEAPVTQVEQVGFFQKLINWILSLFKSSK